MPQKDGESDGNSQSDSELDVSFFVGIFGKTDGKVEGKENACDIERLSHECRAVIKEVNIDGCDCGGDETDDPAEGLFSDAIGDVRMQDANDDSLNDAGDDGMRAKDNVDEDKIECVKITPVCGGSLRRRDGPPGLIEGEPVAAGNAQREIVIGNLVEDAGQFNDLVAHCNGNDDPQDDRYCQDERQRILKEFLHEVSKS